MRTLTLFLALTLAGCVAPLEQPSSQAASWNDEVVRYRKTGKTRTNPYEKDGMQATWVSIALSAVYVTGVVLAAK